jgi:preprotein translocase subunit SecB
MRLSPLQLEGYFLTDLNFRANQDFDPRKEVQFFADDLAVNANVQPVKDQPRRWQVTLSIKLQPQAESNSPYYLSMKVAGLIWLAREFAANKIEALVRTNGPSMLFGVAREMVRDVTARGPFPALSLPSVSFMPESPKAGAELRAAPAEAGSQQLGAAK